jgi:L-asparaginase
MNKVKIFTVGGTIDKIYYDSLSEYEVGAPTIEALLKKCNVYFEFSMTSLMRKDSLDMNEKDRQCILDNVKKCSESHILITHGTDTMVQTASVLSAIKDKTIILTGSLQPAIFKGSDAQLNIGTALGALWTAKPGVYIAMNGFVYEWNDVYKDREKGQFKLKGSESTSCR